MSGRASEEPGGAAGSGGHADEEPGGAAGSGGHADEEPGGAAGSGSRASDAAGSARGRGIARDAAWIAGAVAGGLVFGALISVLVGRGSLYDQFHYTGRWLAVAWLVARRPGHPVAGVLAAALLVAGVTAGQELVPPYGIEAGAREAGLGGSDARSVRDAFDQSTRPDAIPALLAAVVALLARARVPWLAGGGLGAALGGDLAAIGTTATTVAQAAAGLVLAALLAGASRRSRVAALAVAVAGAAAIGTGLLASLPLGHPEIQIIR